MTAQAAPAPRPSVESKSARYTAATQATAANRKRTPNTVKALEGPVAPFLSQSSCSCRVCRSVTADWMAATAVPTVFHSSFVFSVSSASGSGADTFLGLAACHFSIS